MDLHVDVSWILRVAEIAGAGDPAPDDYGIPVAAVACHKADLLEQPVYDGPYARAAALIHILGRRRLERSNLAVAAATGLMYLEASGTPAKPTHNDAAALRNPLHDPACTAASIAALFGFGTDRPASSEKLVCDVPCSTSTQRCCLASPLQDRD